MTDAIDIRAKAPFPAGELSNFAQHRFALDGVPCACMEGFLQSLKIAETAEQHHVCALPGPAAQSAGRKYDWSVTGTLWWNSQPIDRLSDDYQVLLDRAYDALFAQSEKFRAALAATGPARKVEKVQGELDPRPGIREQPGS